MGNVYSAGPEKNLILYNSGSAVLLRTAIAENIGRPVILANDFADSLSSTIWNGTIYYSYQNTVSDILIKSITDTATLYRINNAENPDCFLPSVFTFRQSLLLIYIIKNPLDDSYSAKCIYPFESGKAVTLSEKFDALPKISVVPDEDCFFLHLHTPSAKKVLKVTEKNQAQTLTEETVLSQKFQSQLHKEIKKRDDLIDSIKRQYEELMDTAAKYRDEAMKWRRKYYSE